MDITKISGELGWRPKESLASGLLKTVNWYLENPRWIQAVRGGSDLSGWMDRNYAKRGEAQ
jgi:dTDP-glucose 4,6-dehydratase